MIRPFTLNDTIMIRREAGSGVCLQTRIACTEDPAPLRRALSARLFPGPIPETLVVDQDGSGQGFLQLSHRPDAPICRFRFLAPRALAAVGAGSGMLEALLQTAGRRRAQYLIAEAAIQSEEYALLRREGFSVFARQTVWRSEVPPPSISQHSLPEGALRPIAGSDLPGIAALQTAVVPSIMQQLESLIRPAAGWVLVESGDATGYLRFQSGSRGHWLEPFFHPSVRRPSDWLQAFLANIPIHSHMPVFICLRSYQEGMGAILPEWGFVPSPEQAVLVRRLVVPVPAALPVQLHVAETGVSNVTSLGPPLP